MNTRNLSRTIILIAIDSPSPRASKVCTGPDNGPSPSASRLTLRRAANYRALNRGFAIDAKKISPRIPAIKRLLSRHETGLILRATDRYSEHDCDDSSRKRKYIYIYIHIAPLPLKLARLFRENIFIKKKKEKSLTIYVSPKQPSLFLPP